MPLWAHAKYPDGSVVGEAEDVAIGRLWVDTVRRMHLTSPPIFRRRHLLIAAQHTLILENKEPANRHCGFQHFEHGLGRLVPKVDSVHFGTEGSELLDRHAVLRQEAHV